MILPNPYNCFTLEMPCLKCGCRTLHQIFFLDYQPAKPTRNIRQPDKSREVEFELVCLDCLERDGDKVEYFTSEVSAEIWSKCVPFDLQPTSS